MHAVEEILCAGEFEFAGQLSHAAPPASALNVPTTHAAQVPKTIPFENPALHAHCATKLLPTGESEFAGQLSQLAFPRPALYVPLTHLVHNFPFGPDDPALQVQAVTMLLPAGESECAGQLAQSLFPLSAV